MNSLEPSKSKDLKESLPKDTSHENENETSSTDSSTNTTKSEESKVEKKEETKNEIVEKKEEKKEEPSKQPNNDSIPEGKKKKEKVPQSSISFFGQSPFGSGGGFGAPATPTAGFGSSGGGFGAPPSTFGSGGGFGAPSSSLSFGGFGSQTPTAFGGLGFGATQPTSSGNPSENNSLPQIVINPILTRLNSNLKLTSDNKPKQLSIASQTVNENELDGINEKLIINIDSNFEMNKNSYLTELRWHSVEENTQPQPDEHQEISTSEEEMELLPLPPPVTEMERNTSVIFIKRKEYVPFTKLSHLLASSDKLGNTALHHIAFMKFNKSYETLINFGASKWKLNSMGVCPEAIFQEIATLCSEISPNLPPETRFGNHQLPLCVFDSMTSTLFEKISRRGIIPSYLIKPLFQMNQNCSSPTSLSSLVDSILKLDKV